MCVCMYMHVFQIIMVHFYCYYCYCHSSEKTNKIKFLIYKNDFLRMYYFLNYVYSCDQFLYNV